MAKKIIVRGGGDLATGTIAKLVRSGYDVLVLDIAAPSAIRREVAFCEAIYEGSKTVEDITCYKAENLEQAKELLKKHHLAILVDEEGKCIEEFKPDVLVDAILAKKNLGTHKDMAPITIALGPGFEAGVDVDYVIETKRGHNLARVITQGVAAPNSGVPGVIAGFGKERVIHSPAAGILKNQVPLSSTVQKGQVIATVEKDGQSVPVYATIDGLLRGLIRDSYEVFEGMKIADIDPRLNEYQNCFTISDKARAIAGGVLEAILRKESGYDLRG
jgi:xanthine dehydrogenase accessory factor